MTTQNQIEIGAIGGRLTTRKRILIGAIGGITPSVVTLLAVDFGSAIAGLKFCDGLGLCVRCLVYIFLGGLVAYLYHSEREPFKLFQLGIWAPALVATAVNGYSKDVSRQPQEMTAPTAIQETFLGANYAFADNGESSVAQAPPAIKNEPYLREPEISASDRFFRGLFGKQVAQDENNWFVIVGSHENKEDAFRQVEKLDDKGYGGKVYLPYSGSKYYGVAIGSNISKTEAIKLREEAVKDGLPQDSHLWTH
jgi:hypothetical protein